MSLLKELTEMAMEQPPEQPGQQPGQQPQPGLDQAAVDSIAQYWAERGRGLEDDELRELIGMDLEDVPGAETVDQEQAIEQVMQRIRGGTS